MASGLICRNEIKRRHRQKHKDNGICVDCSEKAAEGKVRCNFHLNQQKIARDKHSLNTREATA